MGVAGTFSASINKQRAIDKVHQPWRGKGERVPSVDPVIFSMGQA